MRRQHVLRFIGYTLTVGAVGLVVPLAHLISLARHPPTSLFLVAVIISAWYGLGEGLLATCLSALALTFYFMPPIYSFDVVDPEDSTRLIAFLLVGTLLTSVTAARRWREEAARTRDGQKTQFLALLAHELRTPLTATLQAAQVLRRRDATPTMFGEAGELIERQVGAMLRLVADLEDAAALGQGKLRMLKTSVDLSEVVSRAVETARPLLDEKGQHLTVRLPPQPLLLQADADRLVQVVANLLKNASTYTNPAGRIWLTGSREGEEVVLRVADTGIGIGSEVMPHIFDLFVQERGAGGGLGVGLSLVRSIVEQHGGSVDVHSEGLGKGSEFTVRLPLPRESATEVLDRPSRKC